MFFKVGNNGIKKVQQKVSKFMHDILEYSQ